MHRLISCNIPPYNAKGLQMNKQGTDFRFFISSSRQIRFDKLSEVISSRWRHNNLISVCLATRNLHFKATFNYI